MAIERVVEERYRCSDGTKFDDAHDAGVHEAELGLRAVCDEHGYSAPSFDRASLYDLLRAHAGDFRDALDAYVQRCAARDEARRKARA